MASQIDPASFLTGGNATFVAELYGRFLEAPDSVDTSWVEFFNGLKQDGVGVDELDAAQWGRMRATVIETNGHAGNGHANGAYGSNGTNGVNGANGANGAAAVQAKAEAVALSLIHI